MKTIKTLLCVIFLYGLSHNAFAQNYYGAIAINPKTGSTGYSYDYSSQRAAERTALSYCGKGCEVAVWFVNTCASVAYSPSKKYYGWAYGDYYVSSALKHCNYKDCQTVVWACTTY